MNVQTTLEDFWSAPIPAPAPIPTKTTPAPVAPIPAPHNGTQASAEAAHHTTTTGTSATRRAQILAIIRAAGERGITRNDIASLIGYPKNEVGARCYELLGRQKDTEGSYPAPLIEELHKEYNRKPDCGGSVNVGVLRALPEEV